MKTVEVDSSETLELFHSVRLQIDNIEAKISHLTPDKPDDYFKDLDEQQVIENREDWPTYWFERKLADAQHSEPDSVSELREYLSKRLQAIYNLLSQKGIYEMQGVKEAADSTVEVSGDGE